MEADSILLFEDMLEKVVKGSRFERVCFRQGTSIFEVEGKWP